MIQKPGTSDVYRFTRCYQANDGEAQRASR
jgi:hypothetical protein